MLYNSTKKQQRNKMEKIEEKIEIAQSRIKEMMKWYGPNEIYVGHSGGKDSSTVLSLVQSCNPDIQVIHNGKKIFNPLRDDNSGPTDVHVDTLEFLYQYTLNQAPFITCVKTHKMKDYLAGPGKDFRVQIDGTRVDEFNRDEKSNTFEINGVQVSRESVTHWHQNGLFGLNFLCPIYDWSSKDVFDYHKLMKIPLSEEYNKDEEYIEWKSKDK